MRKKFNYSTKTGTSLRVEFCKAILSVLLAGCASAPTLVHDAAGPNLAGRQDRNGLLTVYSATAWMSDADGPTLLSHTDYKIEEADGTLFQTVRNGDEAEPARVLLPEGRYVVEAQSDTSGSVRVPVVIKAGLITTLHLEREKDWKEAPVENGRVNLVRLPNGQPIGIRAQSGSPAKS
jgi:hypothetical protein